MELRAYAAIVAFLALLILGISVAVSPPRGSTLILTGTLVESATQEDIGDLSALAGRYGTDAAILESFPMQFLITVRETECEALRAEIESKTYVAEVRACEPG